MIAVVDTSVLVGLVTLDVNDLSPNLIERLATVTPHVPDIVDVEFHDALRGLLLGKKISDERAEHARSLFNEIPKVRFPTRDLTDRIWSLRHNLGAYDACFVALAEALDVPLITADEKQASASGHQARVEAF
ncbi:MAG TPA: type II toxin-antitoxin system VapC family toxin [Pilimelia sp.]|nr:type II toxin-antitoxin system VapC family toxin [Pilimelia sp.]